MGHSVVENACIENYCTHKRLESNLQGLTHNMMILQELPT